MFENTQRKVNQLKVGLSVFQWLDSIETCLCIFRIVQKHGAEMRDEQRTLHFDSIFSSCAIPLRLSMFSLCQPNFVSFFSCAEFFHVRFQQ